MTQMEFNLGLVSTCIIDQYLLEVCETLAFTLFALKDSVLQEYVGALLLRN